MLRLVARQIILPRKRRVALPARKRPPPLVHPHHVALQMLRQLKRRPARPALERPPLVVHRPHVPPQVRLPIQHLIAVRALVLPDAAAAAAAPPP
eukprot:CAMPEP_0174890314 /NCGR_PEP_ID=MMETSP0167-20121228/5485_1 /TAXON_ID=38298 /ORGANISM="Rhodella maculata, Strain CCMP736" /LENGTH=94 /DNA_ID=CAMNT_0016128089 /DNA_START=108 /DNA_END=389 /DNA_ORIENTATION=-